MTIDEFLALIDKKAPPAPAGEIAELEREFGALPADYRLFLEMCNGGYLGGSLWFRGPTPTGAMADAGVHHIGGFRAESHFSLVWSNDVYRGRIPDSLLWIMDDPFGNAICLGLRGSHFGKVYFWDHEMEPDPDQWNGEVDTAGNISLIADSFTDFVAGLRPLE